MQTNKLRLLVNLGILDARRADEISALMVWGMFSHDPLVWERSLAFRDPEFPAMLATDAALKAFAAMTEDEKVALRNRILTQCGGRSDLYC